MTDSSIHTTLNNIMTICSPSQKAYYEQILKDLKLVEVVPLSEVFTQEEIDILKKSLRPKPKECYRNATVLTHYFISKHTIEYVEGYSYKLWNIEHAFNKVDGKYVDITYELALGLDVTQEKYASILEVSAFEIWGYTISNGYYGEYYQHKYNEKLKRYGRCEDKATPGERDI